jgi:hypothetical protein
MTAPAPDARPPICVDGRLLDDGGAGTGVAQYGRTLIAALRDAGRVPLVLESGGAAARRSRPAKLLAAARPWPRTARAGGQGFVLADLFREAQVFFDLHARAMPVRVPGPSGVMHWTYPLPLRLVGWRNLYTVHDVMPLDPAIPSPVNGARLCRLLHALRAAGGTFATVSAAAQRQIVERLDWPAAAVACCHQGVDVAGAATGALPGGLRPGGYLLYVGAVEARKNLLRLLDGYRRSGIATPLVVAGPDGLGADAIDARIATTPGAIRLGLQPRATVLALIAAARALVLVSLSEGFGLPVAEAMALGTPVLAGDVPALAEVAGGAALLVDPLDPAALAGALAALDRDAALRARLAALGARRAEHFALAPYARRLLSLYGTA